MQLASLLEWIEALYLVRLIVTVPGLYPAISALHILGIGLLVGCIAVVDLRLLGVLGSPFDEALAGLVRVALTGFAVAVLTGLLLVSVRIGSYAGNPAFIAKMAILLSAGTNAVALRVTAGSSNIKMLVGTPQGRLAAGLSLTLWGGAVFSGRWIAFL
jgi:hypothetical protein